MRAVVDREHDDVHLGGHLGAVEAHRPAGPGREADLREHDRELVELEGGAVDDAVNVISLETGPPFTTTDPELGAAKYPETVPTVNEYVLSVSENSIVSVVELPGVPSRVTVHEVPAGSPVSVNVTR